MKARWAMVAGLAMLLAGCEEDTTSRLTPGSAVRVVSPDPGLDYVPVEVDGHAAMVEAGIRGMVVLDARETGSAGRQVTILARAADVRMIKGSGDADAYVDLPRSCVRPD